MTLPFLDMFWPKPVALSQRAAEVLALIGTTGAYNTGPLLAYRDELQWCLENGLVREGGSWQDDDVMGVTRKGRASLSAHPATPR